MKGRTPVLGMPGGRLSATATITYRWRLRRRSIMARAGRRIGNADVQFRADAGVQRHARAQCSDGGIGQERVHGQRLHDDSACQLWAISGGDSYDIAGDADSGGATADLEVWRTGDFGFRGRCGGRRSDVHLRELGQRESGARQAERRKRAAGVFEMGRARLQFAGARRDGGERAAGGAVWELRGARAEPDWQLDQLRGRHAAVFADVLVRFTGRSGARAERRWDTRGGLVLFHQLRFVRSNAMVGAAGDSWIVERVRQLRRMSGLQGVLSDVHVSGEKRRPPVADRKRVLFVGLPDGRNAGRAAVFLAGIYDGHRSGGDTGDY